MINHTKAIISCAMAVSSLAFSTLAGAETPKNAPYGVFAVYDDAESVSKLIRRSSLAFGLNPDTMEAIAVAESGLRNVCNWKYEGEDGRFTACGIYQITRPTFRAFCGDPSLRFDPYQNVRCAMVIASTSGLHHWSESGDWK
jgi:hypothetical protein